MVNPLGLIFSQLRICTTKTRCQSWYFFSAKLIVNASKLVLFQHTIYNQCTSWCYPLHVVFVIICFKRFMIQYFWSFRCKKAKIFQVLHIAVEIFCFVFGVLTCKCDKVRNPHAHNDSGQQNTRIILSVFTQTRNHRGCMQFYNWRQLDCLHRVVLELPCTCMYLKEHTIMSQCIPASSNRCSCTNCTNGTSCTSCTCREESLMGARARMRPTRQAAGCHCCQLSSTVQRFPPPCQVTIGSADRLSADQIDPISSWPGKYLIRWQGMSWIGDQV